MPDSAIEAIAQSLDRRADRCRAANDAVGAALAERAAANVRRATSLEEARSIERQFGGAGDGGGPRPMPFTPAPQSSGCLGFGRSATPPPIPYGYGQSPFRSGFYGGSAYSLVGDLARLGGSLAWRTHNPGRLPYNDWAIAHGAIGQENGVAIFPNDEAGRRALVGSLREGGASGASVDDLVRRSYLGADDAGRGGAQGTDDILRAAGFAPGTTLSSLSDSDLVGLAAAIENRTSEPGREMAREFGTNVQGGDGGSGGGSSDQSEAMSFFNSETPGGWSGGWGSSDSFSSAGESGWASSSGAHAASEDWSSASGAHSSSDNS